MPCRLRRGAAALLLLLAGTAAGCAWDFNLAPFAGVKDPITSEGNINGLWAGVDSSGGTVEFQVGSDTVVSLTLWHVDVAGCVWNFTLSNATTPIVDRAFAMDLRFEGQGSMVLNGVFTDSSTCSGSYRFEGLAPAGRCATSGSVSFVIHKTP